MYISDNYLINRVMLNVNPLIHELQLKITFKYRCTWFIAIAYSHAWLNNATIQNRFNIGARSAMLIWCCNDSGLYGNDAGRFGMPSGTWFIPIWNISKKYFYYQMVCMKFKIIIFAELQLTKWQFIIIFQLFLYIFHNYHIYKEYDKEMKS